MGEVEVHVVLDRIDGILDGLPVASCLMLAALCHGKSVETIEGLEKNGKLHPVQIGLTLLPVTIESFESYEDIALNAIKLEWARSHGMISGPRLTIRLDCCW